MLYQFMMELSAQFVSYMSLLRSPFTSTVYMYLFDASKYILFGVFTCWSYYKLKIMIEQRKAKRYPPVRLDINGEFRRKQFV